MAKFELESGEDKIDTWTIMYIAPNRNKFNGKLTVTDKRLIYDAQFDMSMEGIIGQAFLLQTDSGPVISIPKSSIKAVDMEKKFFSKKVIVTLDDGTVHTFNYGMLPVGKVFEAVKMGCSL